MYDASGSWPVQTTTSLHSWRKIPFPPANAQEGLWAIGEEAMRSSNVALGK
jgi:hypothetical protein